MPGKPYQSKLKPYEAALMSFLDQGMSFRRVAETLNQRYHLNITHNAVFSYARTRRSVPRHGRALFFDGLSPDLQAALLRQVAAVWTHDSTAIEGNTLTLGETVKVLELGLTISGKPLREHQEVYGHARAIDLIYRMIRNPAVGEADLFDLHKAVMDKTAMDIMSPVGAWKQEFNGTTGVVDGKPVYMEYAAPADVPDLMTHWLKEFNAMLDQAGTEDEALSLYTWAHMTFVRIHPFFDGNGRIARLIANLPVLRGGVPPIVIPSGRRSDYIDLLWDYQNAAGRLKRGAPFLPPHPAIEKFVSLIRTEWQPIMQLVKEARERDAARVSKG